MLPKSSLDTNNAETLGQRQQSDISKTAALEVQLNDAGKGFSQAIRHRIARPDNPRMDIERQGTVFKQRGCR